MKKGLVLLLAAIMLFTQTGCCGIVGSCKGKPAGELKKIKVILDYVPNTNHTGMYVAQNMGYYEEEGLEVEIVEPTEGATNTLIAAGKGDFGISYQEDVTYALTTKEPLPIKAIATIIQHNTSGFASVKSKNISSPKDFEGKVYAGWGSPAEEAIIKAVMKKDGADGDKIKMVSLDNLSYSMLDGEIDLIWLYWAWDGIAARRDGMDLNYIELRDLDERLDYYTPVIVANNDTLNNEPEKVEAFLRATAKGYNYTIENPEKAAEILHSYAPEYDAEMLKESQMYLAGKYTEGSYGWGNMDAGVWERYMDFMMEYGLIDKKVSASECFTNQYLPTRTP